VIIKIGKGSPNPGADPEILAGGSRDGSPRLRRQWRSGGKAPSHRRYGGKTSSHRRPKLTTFKDWSAKNTFLNYRTANCFGICFTTHP